MKKRRLLAWVLALAMLVSSISVTSFAEEAEAEAAVEEVVSGSAVEADDEAVEADDEAVEADEADAAEEEAEAEDVELEEAEAVDLDASEVDFTTYGDWKATVYGDIGDAPTYSKFHITATSESDVNITGDGNAGKIASASDGIMFYYQPVSVDEDFTISATATINSADFTNDQAAFGLRMADKVYETGTLKGDITGQLDEDGNAVSAAGYGSAINVGGYRYKAGGSLGWVRFSNGSLAHGGNAATYPNAAAAFAYDGAKLTAGASVDLELSYTAATGYVTISYNDITRVIDIATIGTPAEGSAAMEATFEDEIYVGLFSNRENNVDFSNVKLTIGEDVFEAGDWIVGKSYIGTSYTVEPTYDENGDPVSVSFSTTSTSAGKLASTDEEYPYFVSSVEQDANFTMSAHVKVDAINEKNNQGSFGIVLRSDINMDETYSDDMETNSYTAGYKVTDSDGNLLYTYPGSATDRISPAVILGFATKEKSNYFDVGAFLRYLENGTKEASYTQVATLDTIDAGDEFDISVSKSGDAYLATIKDANGNEYSQSLSNENIFSGMIYPGFFAARNVCVTFTDIDFSIDNRVVTELDIITPPTQTEYYVGESINTDGMVVKATMRDALTGEVTNEIIDDYIATLSTAKVGDTVISVMKGAATATTPVHVRKKNVVSIDVEYNPIINRYYEYQLFTTDGISGTITYEDGAIEEIGSDNVVYTVEGAAIDETKFWRASEAGTKTVYISLAETDTLSPNNITASYDIVIYPYTLDELIISTPPLKTAYVVGEELITDGLLVTGVYSDGVSLYYDTIYEAAYSLSGFNSSAVGTTVVTVTLNENRAFKTEFNCTVSENVLFKTEISKYPRTTFPTGTSKEAIQAEFVANTVITRTYSDESTIDMHVYPTPGEKDPALTEEDYSVNVSKVNGNVNGDYIVTLTPVNSLLPVFEVSVTIWSDKTYYWNTAKFGATSTNSSYSLSGVDENGLAQEAHIVSYDGAGKVTNSGHDGIMYYYTRVDSDNNFSISGDIEVNKFLQASPGQNGTNKGRYGQEAFGIMARDVIPLKPASGYGEDSETFEGLGTKTVVLTENASVDENGEPVPNNSGDDFFSNVVIAGGFATSSYPSTFLTASNIAKANDNRIKMWIRYGMEAWNGSAGSATNLEYLLYDGSEFGDYLTTDAQLASGECFYPKPGDKFHITLTRLNGGYYEECTILAVGSANAQYADLVGTTWSYAWDWTSNDDIDVDPLTVQNADTIYAGFFAARWADITVTNIDIYESNPDTDCNSASATDEVETPGLSIISDLYTTNTDYSLMLKTTNTSGGRVVVKVDDEVVANGLPVTKKGNSIDLDLDLDTKYEITICYTPSKYDNLTTYDTITYRETLYCLSGVAIEGDTIYAAPVEGEGESKSGVYGSFKGAGTLESPLDIDAAIAVVKQGQEIVLLNGTYYRDETIKIPESNYGFKTEYKVMRAETDREVIIDMQRSAQGISMAGDCWWVKGIVFRNSAMNSQGGGVSAQDCIIENCVFEDSGSTGFQISGSSADTFDLWPANNLVINCESYNSMSGSAGSADGFGCKLTVGNGNIFKGCVSHNNDDDGWDLYTKASSGPIGAVLLEDCISYNCSYYLITENNYNGANMNETRKNAIFGSLNAKDYAVNAQVPVQSASASGNGFKLGGENIYVQHYIKDSFAFSNKSKGFDSNSNPAMKVRNCISFNNGNFKTAVNERGFAWTINSNAGTSSNFGLYSGVTDKVFNYNLDGAISVCAPQYDNIATFTSYTDGTNQADSAETLKALTKTANETNSVKNPVLTLDRSTEACPVETAGNYLVKSTADATTYTWGTSAYDGYTYTGYAGYNSEGEEVTPDWFVNVEESKAVGKDGRIQQNPDGTYNMNGFLQLKDEHQYTYNDVDVPVYNYAYCMYFGIDNIDTDTGNDDATEATTTANRPSSGGGGGGSSRVTTTTTTAAADSSSDDDTEATTAASNNSNGSDNTSSNIAINPPVEVGEAPAFEDIANKTWAVNAINKLASLGIVSGVTPTLFCPDNNMTRGDFCVLITRLLGLEGGTSAAPFSDVSQSSYYSSAIGAAVEAGIAQGYGDGTFKPSQYITRQEMFVLIAKTYEAFGADISADLSVLDKFADGSEVADWAAPYAAFLVENGIVNGTDGKINPNVAITRAESAVLLSNVYDDAVEVYNAYVALEAAAAALEAEETEAEEAEESEEAEVSEEETEAVEAEESEEAASDEEETSVEEEAEAETEAETEAVEA